jgi:hypothetical protein
MVIVSFQDKPLVLPDDAADGPPLSISKTDLPLSAILSAAMIPAAPPPATM